MSKKGWTLRFTHLKKVLPEIDPLQYSVEGLSLKQVKESLCTEVDRMAENGWREEQTVIGITKHEHEEDLYPPSGRF